MVKNFEFQYFEGFQKNEYFKGMKILWIFFFFGGGGGGCNHKIVLCILGCFLKVKVQNGDIFLVAKISNILLGVLDIP